MNPRKLTLFKEKKGIYISLENIIAISWAALIFLIYYLKQSYDFDFKGIETGILVLGTIYIIGLLISTFFRYESEVGEYCGRIIFHENHINIENNDYYLEEIQKLEFFSTFDVKGDFTNYLLEFTPHLSNGLSNSFILTLKNGKQIEYNFLQTKSEQIKYYKDVLTNYYKKGIISWLELLNTLNIEDYNEIQNFKKELTVNEPSF
ncbi:hypothetical protein LPB136_01850 [Tenacibaculum todarodis]|uniref:Uncharacterized protein n=1 Tax=Tenacibaculum todarodis TaxID=1850252 RepID=A0A1L3JGC2_9FLAO|nr:hypothetical protein [Tenacibaculum todarodis]APG64185.1 hypothetical protein LPB136_01850 [Tenacibaculum todarodis]